MIFIYNCTAKWAEPQLSWIQSPQLVEGEEVAVMYKHWEHKRGLLLSNL